MSELKQRQDINPEFIWHLTDIFPDDAAWEAAYHEVKTLTDELSHFNGQLSTSPDVLLDFIRKQDELGIKFGKVYGYAHMNWHVDTDNSYYQEKAGKADSLEVDIASKLSFTEPELLAIPEETIKAWLTESDALKIYQHFFDDLYRKKAHILSKEQEELMALAQDVGNSMQNIFSMFNNADIDFPEVIDDEHKPLKLTHGRYIKLLSSEDREVRKTAFTAMYETFAKSRNTLASVFSDNLKNDVFNMKARGYKSTCEAALSRNNITVDVYDRLIDTVNQHLGLLHRYVSLRKRMLGLEELHMYDLYTPMLPNMEIAVPFEEAKDTCLKALAPMGEAYVGAVKHGFDHHWLDVYENKNKRSGAYSWGVFGVHPYVLLNYDDTMDNMFTLAHEMGHAMHSYLSSAAQPYVYHRYPIFLADVLSTFTESLFMNYLLHTTEDKKKRMYLINQHLEGFRGTLFRQTMFAEFEKMTHVLAEQGETLTADKLSSLYYELNKKYFGEELIVDELIKYEWARIPHFYYNYYVFQYATGFSSAIAISENIKNEGQTAVKQYTEAFLKAGKSKYPLETLKDAGVDMTTAAPIEKAMKVFEALIDEMEELISE